MQLFSIMLTGICLLLFLPLNVRSEMHYFAGYLDVVHASGKACEGMRGRHKISLIISNDLEQGLFNGFFGGDSVTVGRISGSSQETLAVRYPYQDPTRAEGHTLKIAISGKSLVGELHDRHINATIDDCNFDYARLTMKMSENGEQARVAYQKLSGLYEAQLAKSTAISFSRKGAHTEAAPLYEKALSFADMAFGVGSPKLNTYLTGLANSYMRLGRFADFNILYQERHDGIRDEAVHVIFNNYRIRSLLQVGKSAMGREDYPAALEQFREAYKLDGKNKDSIAAIMSALVRSGRHDEAITFLQETENSLDNEPDRRDVRGALALVHYQKAKRDEKSGRSSEAEASIRKAIQLDPDTFQYLITLSRWRHKSGNYIEADSILKKALERFKDEAIRSEIAAAREKLRQTEMILTKIRRAGD
ncbi:MAG: tetratricopeptide repeat protein [Deltaproteobacteria bacterium]|nr:tetratricopeptide repeat protein [Deltaproteobacteria bacterium]